MSEQAADGPDHGGMWPRTVACLEAAVAADWTAGAVVEVRVDGVVVLSLARGEATRRPTPVAMSPGTWFDLASLTKVLATLPSVLALAEDGALGLDEPASRFLAELQGEHASYSLRHLLTHTAGLSPDLPWRSLDPDRTRLAAYIAGRPLTAPPGSRLEYSDVGYLLLGLVVERVTGQTLERFVSERIHRPLGACVRYGPVDPQSAAATEDAPDGSGPLRGVVHDEKSRTLGGICGHAGLFGTASGVAAVAEMFRREGRGPDGRAVLAPQTVRAALRPAVTGDDGNRRCLGFELAGGVNSAGDLLGPRSFGHTGFTGTSVWVDPDQHLSVVLLTNRVHLGRENGQIVYLRKRVHNAVVGDLARL